MNGLIAYGTYVPYNRLRRGAIGDAFGEPGGRGTRSVASYDEDTTSMAVEASRIALRAVLAAAGPQRLIFATSAPAYLDKTNATIVHAALRLDPAVLAVDAIGGVRSGVGALVSALDASEPVLAVLSDVRTGLPGGSDERDGGDGAAALLFGPGSEDAPVLARLLAQASATAEFLDRWRLPGAPASRLWEERFGETAYVPLAEQALNDALKKAGITVDQVDSVAIVGLQARANRSFAAKSGIGPDRLQRDFVNEIGNTGTAHAGIALASALDNAAPGQTIALVVLADGATAFIFQRTHAIKPSRDHNTIEDQIAAGSSDLTYSKFLTWRGHLSKEPPRRPDPVGPAAPPTLRNARFKYGFVGSRCDLCDTAHLPPARVCLSCHSVDQMLDVAMSDIRATVATFTVDRLAYSPNPPAVVAVIDFDGGGRFSCELTDVDPARVAIGDRVEMTFRRMVLADGVHNYFWKAKPITEGISNSATEG